MKYHVLYNPEAGNGTGAQGAEDVKKFISDFPVALYDVKDAVKYGYAKFMEGLAEDDRILIVGGDGTLNRFINDTEEIKIVNPVYYYAAGSGNDFWTDIGRRKGDAPVCIDEYLKDLPTVTVNGKTYRFLNGVGYGIDGYCCEVGDKLRELPDAKIDYTSIAIKGLLFHYKPANATVTVDGESRTYKNVWIAPTMNGRYYGGGMMPTPAQDRLNEARTVSVCLLHRSGKLKTLMVFPSLFKGEHVKHAKQAEVLSGKTVNVKFDRPCALQIDGETILGVTEYTVHTAK